MQAAVVKTFDALCALASCDESRHCSCASCCAVLLAFFKLVPWRCCRPKHSPRDQRPGLQVGLRGLRVQGRQRLQVGHISQRITTYRIRIITYHDVSLTYHSHITHISLTYHSRITHVSRRIERVSRRITCVSHAYHVHIRRGPHDSYQRRIRAYQSVSMRIRLSVSLSVSERIRAVSAFCASAVSVPYRGVSIGGGVSEAYQSRIVRFRRRQCISAVSCAYQHESAHSQHTGAYQCVSARIRAYQANRDGGAYQDWWGVSCVCISVVSSCIIAYHVGS